MNRSSKHKKNPNVILTIEILFIILLAVFNFAYAGKFYPRFMISNISNINSSFKYNNEEKSKIVDALENSMQMEDQGSKNDIIDSQQSNSENCTFRDFPVDVVYTWVNGSDPIWIEKKDEAMKKNEIKIGRRAQIGRYIDIGELKYSLRCIEKFIPWVHKIYIVTDNQFPDFLKENQTKLEIIDHKIIIKEQFLPTFNSNNIDFHLHLIPNLTEHFIYLNDDVFISRPLQKCHFFDEKGKPIIPVARFNWEKQRKSIEKKQIKHWSKNDMGSVQYTLITMRTVDVFERKFNITVNFKCRHGYIPLTKTILNDMWTFFKKDLAKVENHTFRSYQDIQMPTLLIQFGIGLNYSSILHSSQSVRYLVMTGKFINKLKEFNSTEYDSFCLNSGEKTSDHMRIAAKEFLELSYPEKSSFEV